MVGRTKTGNTRLETDGGLVVHRFGRWATDDDIRDYVRAVHAEEVAVIHTAKVDHPFRMIVTEHGHVLIAREE